MAHRTAAAFVSAPPSDTQNVSVVIPALNEEGSIGRLLDALAAQSVPVSEVIVVDAGSTDATPWRSRSSGGTIPSL